MTSSYVNSHSMPNIHIYINVQEPKITIRKVNEFLGTDRSPELIQQIAEATKFSKMKEGKLNSMQNKHLLKQVCFNICLVWGDACI